MPVLQDTLPTLYRSMLPALFRREVPEETKATCSHCSMCDANGVSTIEAVDGQSRLFKPDTKCCTYYPRLANYLVGALLSDDTPSMDEGRRRIREKLASRVGVTPQWVKPPAKWTLLYEAARGAFGKSTSLRCPYYEPTQGHCTIWAFREAVCSTFFCKYVAGADGRKFWMSTKQYLALVEIQLARYSLLQLMPEYILAGKDAPVTPTLSPQELDETAPSEKEYAALWGSWAGREEELYKRSFELVRGLSAEQLQTILGLDGKIFLERLEQSYAGAIHPKLPKLLQLNANATVKWMQDGSVALGQYSEYDALALPGEAYDLLKVFTGREPVEAVRERLRNEHSADLSEEVLLTLYQHRILTEA